MSIGQGVEASAGFEPTTVRLEGARPRSIGEANSGAVYGDRTRREFLGKDF